MKNKLLNKLRMLLPIAAATLLMPLSASAQTRIAVVSDIHVMAPSLLPSGAEDQDAWKNYYAGQRKMLDKSAAIFDKFVGTMIHAKPKPHILLITGDLTKDGEQVSHNYVKEKLHDLEEKGIQCYVIPGNHDFGQEGSPTQFNADGTTSNAAVLSHSFATFYADYGYTGSTVDPNNSLSYVAEPVEGLILLAIDSHSGSIDDNTLTWLCSQASQARANGKQVIAMMHHPLFPHITGADLFISTYTVDNYETVRNKLINAGVNVILTGHFHTSDIAKDWNDDASKAIYDINTGSLISYPCDYRMLELSQDKQTLNVRTYSLTPTGMTAEECKTWLNNRMATIITKKMTDKGYGALASTAASVLAEAFIFHAEGDENQSTDASSCKNILISTYLGANAWGIIDQDQYNDLCAMTYSMLDDKSNYGTGKVNQTDDRNLDILSIPTSGWATYCTTQDIDISRTSGLKAYIVTAINAEEATLTEITKIPKREGFMLYGSAGTYALMASTEAVDAITNNKLVGTLVATTAVDGNYALATKYDETTRSNVTAFYPVNAGISIPAHKAYIASISSNARLISLGGDGETDIQFVEKSLDYDADQPIYTLQGTRATSLRPGIYIQNGKKVVMK